MNELSFKHRVVAITGAASGIGRATALAFAKQGAAVSLLDINPSVGEVGKLIIERRGQAICTVGDVADPAVVDTFHSRTLAAYRRVHFLINNAGIELNDRGNLVTMPWQDAERILRVNLFGYIYCCRAFLEGLPGDGRVVNVSSVQGLTAHRPGTSYQISKSGILGLTHALAIEYGPRGITVNAVAPGAIATEGIGAARAAQPNIVDAYGRRIPLGRRGTPREIAGPILFLCSKEASYINGTCLVIDGGYTINITPDTV